MIFPHPQKDWRDWVWLLFVIAIFVLWIISALYTGM